MNDALQTIEFLAAKAKSKADELISIQKLINGLCAESNLPLRYPNIADLGDSVEGMRKDQFYGQTLTSAARSYLEMRKARGAASVNEIHKAVRDGGYKFDTKEEEHAKAALRTILRKNSAIFHRLPTGDYGLLSWYPNAKPVKAEGEEDDDEPDNKISTGKVSRSSPKPTGHKSNGNGSFVGDQEVRAVIFALADAGQFTSAVVEKAIPTKYGGRLAKKNAASILISKMKKKGLLRVVSERTGASPAIYTKA